MTHPMPDPSTPPEPTKRMTTAEAAKTAQDAMALAASVTEDVERLDEKLTELDQRVRDAASTTVDPADVIDAEGKPALTRDQVDSRIHEALQPLHDEVHELRTKGTLTPETTGSLSGVLARLEDMERKVAAVTDGGIVTRVVQEFHPVLNGMRDRLTAVEETAKALSDPGSPLNSFGELPARIGALEQELKSHGDPVSATLAEDHLSDQLEGMVDRKVAAMFEAAGLTPARLANLTREFDDLRTHIETHGTHVTRAIIDQVAAGVDARPTGRKGASAKVLQLMRQITHIGKEKEANLGKGGRFQFRGIDDAMDAVGHAMRDVGLVLSTEVLDRETTLTPVTQQGTDNGQKWERTVVWATSVVTMRYTFTDPEDGSTHVFEMVGEGRDSSDKSTSKATSMACKYGLFQALMIPVTGLDDADDAPPQQMMNQRPVGQQHPSGEPTVEAQDAAHKAAQAPTEEQRAHRAGEALAAIRNLHRVPRPEQYNRLVQIMNRVKQEGLLEFALEGSTLNQHGEAAMHTLQAPPPDDARASTEPPEPPADYR
jgi:hypothetical protein